jgi:hypothetical protein
MMPSDWITTTPTTPPSGAELVMTLTLVILAMCVLIYMLRQRTRLSQRKAAYILITALIIGTILTQNIVEHRSTPHDIKSQHSAQMKHDRLGHPHRHISLALSNKFDLTMHDNNNLYMTHDRLGRIHRQLDVSFADQVLQRSTNLGYRSNIVPIWRIVPIRHNATRSYLVATDITPQETMSTLIDVSKAFYLTSVKKRTCIRGEAMNPASTSTSTPLQWMHHALVTALIMIVCHTGYLANAHLIQRTLLTVVTMAQVAVATEGSCPGDQITRLTTTQSLLLAIFGMLTLARWR